MTDTPTTTDTVGFAPQLPLGGLRDSVNRVREAITNVLVGQEEALDLLLIALISDGHVLIEGAPGLAKTLTAKLLARTVDTGFGRLQFTPDLMPSDVIGTSVFDPRTTAFEFRPGPIFSNIVLVDEINRAPAKTQAALFEVMEERQATVDGVRHLMGSPFMILATQNPIEQEGTYRLPEAQLDRFFFKIVIGYPALDQEVLILQRAHEGQGRLSVDGIAPVLTPQQLTEARALVRSVKCEAKLLRYIAQLVDHTRTDHALSLGASPRASLAMLIGAKAAAAIAGRDFVIPEDIHFVATPVLRHRIQLTPEREMEGLLVDDVVKRIIERTEVPR
ncbi:MAG: MoxR family ATPase [Flavobacteriales bacterium]|nr:MoxR family ATPase [Flavobacteriales bacterium]